jgi:YidC/Oxa1 family membrane protein insertase
MSTEPNKPDPKELPINIRMLVAFALTGLVIIGTPYFYKAVGIKLPEKPEQQAAESKAQPPAAAIHPATAAAPPINKPAPAPPPSTASVSADSQVDIPVDTDVFHIVFSNQGAVVKNWTLKQFPDHSGKPLDVVNTGDIQKTGYPFQYEFRSANPPALNQKLFKIDRSPDGLSVSFEYAGDGVTARKSFSFKRDSYMVAVTSSLSSASGPLPHLLAWHGGFGDMAVPSPASQQGAVFYDLAADKVTRSKAKDAKNGPVNKDGTFGWVGLEDHYFASVFLPAGNGTLQTTIYDNQVKPAANGSEDAFIGLALGGEGENRWDMYLGPKDVETLRRVNPKLESIVDFGFFHFIAKPLFFSLKWMYDNWARSWGWCIILATVIINMLLFPLKIANLKSMRKMQALQPEIAKINEKYKNLPLRDPKQADKNAEMMALYSKAGTNPMSGCIPMLVQMPFLWAFYTVLSVSIALRGASWLWVNDLSQPEQIPIRILPILLVITGFVMQKMTPMTTVDPSQQKTMMLMPLMMGFIFYQASSGLVLYWLTGNLVGIAQQWLLNRAMPKPDTPAPATKDVKKGSNRK